MMGMLLMIAGLPGVLWVLPDSYIDVPNKDYGGKQLNQVCHLKA
jgi:hypothetical protein